MIPNNFFTVYFAILSPLKKRKNAAKLPPSCLQKGGVCARFFIRRYTKGYAGRFQTALFNLPILDIPVIVKLRISNPVYSRLDLITVKQEDRLVVQRKFK